jgi:hypothetical protein
MASATPAAAGGPTPPAADNTGNGARPGLSRRQILLIIGALMLGMLLAAIDDDTQDAPSCMYATIIATVTARLRVPAAALARFTLAVYRWAEPPGEGKRRLEPSCPG